LLSSFLSPYTPREVINPLKRNVLASVNIIIPQSQQYFTICPVKCVLFIRKFAVTKNMPQFS